MVQYLVGSPNVPDLGYGLRQFMGFFLVDPCSVKLREIWSEIKMVRCSGDPMEVLLGGQQRLSTHTIRQFPGRVMCEVGDLGGLADGRSLSYTEAKVAGSF